MEGWLNQTGMIRTAVLLSFAAHLGLILLAGIRRRKASGGRTLLLWLAYQLANWASAYALGSLSMGSTSQEKPQLVAFWAPFLLQHLGGPDNISAYSLEDNVLSGRQALNVLVQVGGAIYVVYKHIYLRGGDRALLPSSITILAVGVVKYVERVLALWQGNLGNIRSSSKKKKKKKLRRFQLAFGREFQEDVLVWHIATQVFLMCGGGGGQSLMHGKSAAAAHAKAVKALSEYLMFLVAVRPRMLPGLVLRSLYEVTFDALQDIWRKQAVSSSRSRLTTTGKEREGKLARILHDKMDADSEWGLDHDKTRLVSDGANIAMALLEADESEMPEVLELVFNVWVDKLLYAGTRCSRESHARQLSRGGELTTVVWILAEHVGPFQIGRCVPDDKKRGLPPPCPLPVPKKEEPCPPPFMYPPPSTAPWPPSPHYFEQPKNAEPSPPQPPLPRPKEKPAPPMQRSRRYATLYPVD